MTIRIGNSSSPRWYSGSRRRFAAYLDHLTEWGATSTELVLHHGPFDIRTARVHVMERDWERLVTTYRGRGIDSQFHVSLDRRFATQRWGVEPDALKAEYRPLLRFLGNVAGDQDVAVLVLHGASDPRRSLDQNEIVTAELLTWLAEEVERLPASARVGLELGAYKPERVSAAARSRVSIERIIDHVGSPRVGICWDVAHDFENSRTEAGWQVVPGESFLRKVVHLHLHDVDATGVSHYPLLLGRVPFHAQLSALRAVQPLPPMTMEVRWRCARRLGHPWEVLGQSYRAVESVVQDQEALASRIDLRAIE